MDIVNKNGIYYVSGDVTEASELGSYSLPTGTVKFDLGAVRTINSCGVREWISWIAKLKISPIYINCPQSVIMQFNMVKEFLRKGVIVESFQVPAYCEHCGEQKIYILKSGVDFIPGQKLEYEIKKCEQDGCSVEADVDFESYFYFIEELKP